MRSAIVRSILASLAVMPAVAVLTVAGISGQASAGIVDNGTRTTAGCPAVEIAGRPDGFTAPRSVAAGIRTFRVTTTDPAGVVLGLFRLRSGVVLDDFLPLLRVALNGEGQDQVEAGNEVARQSTLFGGINTVPGRPATFTQGLLPGTYHLIDYQDVLAGPEAPLTVEPLVVTDGWRPCVPPVPRARIEMLETSDGPRFRAPATLSQGTPILVHNRTGHVEEAVFTPVGPDVTADDVRAFFQALDDNQQPPSFPFTGPPRGMPVIHESLAAVIVPNLSPGRYALMTWLVDEEARHQVAQGMVEIVTVR